MFSIDRLLLLLLAMLCNGAAVFAQESAAPAAPRTSIADVEKAKSLLHSGKREEAVKHLEESIRYWTEQTKSKPKDAQLCVDLARVLFEFQQDDQALAAIDEALKLSPDLGSAHAFRGIMHHYAGQQEKARREFEKAVSLAPRDAEIRMEFVQFLSFLKKSAEEKTHLAVVLEVDPKRIEAYEELSLILAAEGKAAEELDILQQCAEKNPDSPKARQMLGQHYQNQEKHAEAYEQFAAAAKIAPEDMRSATKLVQLCAALGKKEELKQRLANVKALFEKNGHSEKWFCREQFKIGEHRVMAIETFKLEGPQAVRYGFYVTEKGKTQPSYRISLGSYDGTTEVARSTGAIGKEDRMFHLDYYRDREHRTYGMFAKEPSYDEVRTQAIEIIEGKNNALSGSTMPEKNP